MKTLGDYIRELRDKQDLSLREFARRLGDTSPAHVSDIENGRRSPSPALLAKIAEVLSVPVTEFEELDTRLPLEELKKAIRREPALGFALRKMAEGHVTAEELMRLTDDKRKAEDDKR